MPHTFDRPIFEPLARLGSPWIFFAAMLTLTIVHPASAQECPLEWARADGLQPPQTPQPFLLQFVNRFDRIPVAPSLFPGLFSFEKLLPNEWKHRTGAELFGWGESFVVGVTTYDEVLQKHPDLKQIRPPRASVLILESPFGGNPRTGLTMVLYFDQDTKRLLDAEFSYFLCGYCPHILVNNDGHWRLEGKMLAGCVGAERAGDDALVMSTLQNVGATAGIRLANWAPEIEHLKEVALAVIPLKIGEEVDLDRDRRPWIVKGLQRIVPQRSVVEDHERWEFTAEPAIERRVLIVEMRNGGDFETVMRNAVLNKLPWPAASLTARFDTGETLTLPPVGTKFPRRLVIPMPAKSSQFSLEGPNRRWSIRRAWIAQGERARDVTWLPPTTPDLQPLNPLEEIDLTFKIPPTLQGRVGVVLRMSGYYDFVPVTNDLDRKLHAIRLPN